MMTIQIRLYEELNRVLKPAEKKRPFWKEIPAGTSLGQLIAALGLSHDEVDLGLVNSRPAGFHQIMREQDRVSLFPEFESFNIGDLSSQESGPLRRTRFVIPPELSVLGERLWLMGYDSTLTQNSSLEELIAISRVEKRILLTRNPEIAAISELDRCLCLHSNRPDAQMEEVIQRLQL